MSDLAFLAGAIATAAIERVAAASKALGASPAWIGMEAALRRTSNALDAYGIGGGADGSPAASDPGPTDAAVAIVKALGEMLHDDAIESTRGDTVVFRIRPVAVDGDKDAQLLARIIGELEARAEVRVRSDTRAELTLLTGAKRQRSVTVGFSADGLDFDIDLAGGVGTFELLSQLASKYLPQKAVATAQDVGLSLTSARGTLRVSLHATGNASLRQTVAIPEALEIIAEGDSGPYTLGVAASPAAWVLDADGEAGAMHMGIAVGAMTLRAPNADFADKEAAAGEVEIDIPGLTLRIDFDANQDRLTLAGLGLGDRTARATRDGKPLVELDLNADKGRAVDLSFQPPGADGSQVIDISPRLNLALAFRLASIRHELAEDFPAYMLDETYSLAIGGVGGTQIVTLGHRAGEPSSGGVLVRKGKLTLKSTASAKAVIVPEGKALITRAADKPRLDEAHPVLRMLDAAKPKLA